MDTPYGEIPDNLIKGMTPQDMHDYLRRRFSRRSVLKGAAAVGAVAAVGPLFWKRSYASASAVPIPQWISYGPNPATSMYISFSNGNYDTATISSNPTVFYGLTNSYGSSVDASQTQAPIPTGYTLNSSDVDDTYYMNVLLTGLTPGTTYHYAVSYDGVNLGPDSTFTTALAEVQNFRWVGTGDQATSSASTAPVAEWIAAQGADFVVVAGDLSYASGGVLLGEGTPSTAQPSYSPSAWDTYLSIFGFNGFQSLPVYRGVGNHEMEPLSDNGYAGTLTRFPQNYVSSSITGGPVNQTWTYGNVAFIILDGNDVSAEISDNNGYTGGLQTTWLESTLASYRSGSSTVDFIVVSFHNCMFCSNTTHGSDGGNRNAWQSIFDTYNVDLVINGHVHAYERTYPIKVRRRPLSPRAARCIPKRWARRTSTPATAARASTRAGTARRPSATLRVSPVSRTRTSGPEPHRRTAPKPMVWTRGSPPRTSRRTRRAGTRSGASSASTSSRRRRRVA
jgi:hypothetical protein